MANTLPDDLREYALCVFLLPATTDVSADMHSSLPATGFPKGFYCALDGQVALDAYKLLCCNKVICPPCELICVSQSCTTGS